MRDFIYVTASTNIIEDNHRLAFDRHTIKQTHPLLKHSNVGRSENGFALVLYARASECNAKVDRTKPLKIGNMGDIFGSHLADYFSKLTKLRFATQCGYRNIPEKSGMNLTFSLVGSIARPSMSNKNTVLLGVGTIAINNLDGAILRNDPNLVFGVRGPRTRDTFLAKFGINPEVVGDPGVYLCTILKKKVDEVRKNVKGMRNLCFISHEVEVSEFRSINTAGCYLRKSYLNNLQIIKKQS